MARAPAVVNAPDLTPAVARQTSAGGHPVRDGEFRRLASTRGVGILLVENNVEVLRTCDRVYAVDLGARIGAGSPDEIRANPAVVEVYLGTAAFRADRTSRDGAESGSGSQAGAGAGWPLRAPTRDHPDS